MKKFAFIVATAISLAGCGNNRQPATHNAEMAAYHGKPLRVVLLVDKSLSFSKESTIGLEDTRSLLDSVERNGGAFAYGEIREHKRVPDPFLQLEIVAPPPPPPADTEKNPMRQRTRAQKDALSTKYVADRKIWEDKATQLRADFENAFKLKTEKRESLASYSDIETSLKKADNLISQANNTQMENSWLIVVSDMRDDYLHAGCNKKYFTGLSGDKTNPILIIGADGAGNLDLDKSRFRNFTNITQVIEYISNH